MKKHFLKSFALIAMLFSAISINAESAWCNRVIGHFDPNGVGDKDDKSYVRLTVQDNQDGTISFIVAADPTLPKAAPDVDYVLINPGIGTAGDDATALESQTVKYSVPAGTEKITVEILWSYSNWGGRYMVQNLEIPLSEICGTSDSGEGGEDPVDPTPEPETPGVVYCDFPTGHEGNATFGDPDGRILVSVIKKSETTVRLVVKSAAEANRNLDLLYVEAAGANPHATTVGSDVAESDLREMSVDITYPTAPAKYNFMIQWSHPNWTGRWQTNLNDITVEQLCTEGGETPGEGGETPSTPTEIYDVNFALASNGSSAEATTGNAAAAIDNNIEGGSRWESAQEDPQTWTLDLGQARIFNTLEIVWEGAYGKTFTVSVSDDKETWTPVWTVEGQELAGFPYTQTQTIDKTTARYIQFHGTERGTGYGYSFWEFRVYLAGTSVLTSLEAKFANNITKVGETNVITLVSRDQNGQVMETPNGVTYTITPADAGTITDNVYTPAKIGSATIVAAIGEVKAAAFDVFAYDGENVALSTDINTSKIVAQSDFAPNGTDAWHAIDGNEGSVWQGSATNGTADDEASRTYDSWFVVDFGAYYDINLVSIKFEGACSQEYTVDFSANNATWSTAYEYVGNAGAYAHTKLIYGNDLQNNTKVRYARFYSTKAATIWGMKMFEFKVFGTPGEAPADDEKPVMVKAELVSNTFKSAIIAVEATDNNAVANYKVVDASNALDQSCTAKDGKITVSLEPATEYTLTIYAVDLVGNISENSKEVKVTTPAYVPTPNVAAPVPDHDAKDVLSIYSDAYSPAWTTLNGFNENWWQAPSMEEKEIDGDKFLRYHALISGGMVGWQFAKFDASGMTYIHVDIWPSISGEIKMGPTSDGEGGGNPVASVTLAVVQEQWNSFDIPVTDLQAANASFDLTKVFQNQFTEYSAQTEFSVDNVYFWKPSTTTSVKNTQVELQSQKLIRNGVLYIIRNGVTYDVMGRVVR